MQNKFIYVFDTKTRDKLISDNYQLLKCDDRQSIFVFANKETQAFSDVGISDSVFVFSDTLTF